MSNRRDKFVMEFDRADAPMLVHALGIAANTAMMCGHPQAQKKLQAYREAVKAFAPPEADRFDEEVWAEMGIALLTAKRVDVGVKQRAWEHKGSDWWSEGTLVVTVDGREFRGDRGGKPHVRRDDGVTISALYEVVKEMAPMEGCSVGVGYLVKEPT